MVIAIPQYRDYINLFSYRELDQGLPPDTKIFFSGVVGPNDHLASYYFVRSILFPREVEISIDHKADFQFEGFRGVDCQSPEELRTNGYDLMLKLGKIGTEDHVMAFPLTTNGVLKQ